MRTSTGCGPGKTARTEETSNKKTAGRPGAARCKAAQKEIEIMEQKAPQTEHLIYGKNPVTELLKSGAGVDTVLLSDGLAPQVAAYYTAMAKEAGAVVKRVKPAKLKAMCETDSHQGVAAWASQIEYATLEQLLDSAAQKGEPPFLVLADGV